MNALATSLLSGPALPWLVFAAGLVAGLVALLAPAGRDRRLQRRLERARRAARTVADPGEEGPPTSVRRQDEATILGGIGAALAALMPRTTALRAHLDRAGIRLAVGDVLLAALALGVLVALVTWLVLGLGAVLASALGAAAAVGGPMLVVRRAIARREARFLAAFPDALDLVVRGVRSGLPVIEALNAIAREMPEPVASVFAELGAHLRIGLSLPEAFAIVGNRVALPEFRFFAISLVVQQETGGNLAEILQNLATMLRRRQQMRLKVKAMSSEARASAAIIGALPFLTGTVISWINPDYMAKLITDPRGWIMLAAGACSMLLGVAVMAKMVRFEI
jgi:tight adherence protein B